MNNPYNRYRKTQVTTASKEKILLMLYEGAIKFTKQAKVALEEKKIADKGRYISKATAILSELMATLDFKVGGELAQDLENLYVFMIDKLIEGNISNDPACLDTVEDLLRTLYSAWKDVVENPRPDGVPSKELQPDLYKQWVDQQSEEGGESPVTPKSVTVKRPDTEVDDRPKLKLMA